MTQVTNLFPDPHPNSIAHWLRFNSTPDDFEFRMTIDSSAYYIRRISDKTGIGLTRALMLPAGEYVLGLFVSATYPNNDHVMLVKNTKSGAYVCEVRVSQRDQYIAKRFTMPAGGVEILIVPPGNINQATAMKTMLLVTLEDWNHMYEEDIHWFAPPTLAATGQAVPPDLLTGGGACSSPARCYPHWVVAA